MFSPLVNGIEFFQDERSAGGFLGGQKFNQLFIIFRNLSFCGELLLSQFKTLLLLVFFHLFDVDVIDDGVDNWLGLERSGHLDLGHGHHPLGNDAVAVHSDVLEERVRNEGISGEICKEFNLLRLGCFFHIKVNLI